MDLTISRTYSHLLEDAAILSLIQLAAREDVSLYLVGGTVRDLLLGREMEDLDFAVDGDASDFAQKFAKSAKARFVPLDEDHDTARVVFYKGRDGDRPYMDFCGIRGADIIEDLAARDFTINAMAVDLRRVTDGHEAEVIDPCGGIADLSDGLVRIAYAESIRDDPIRMFRAYRFAAALDFTIHDDTSAEIRNSVGLLDSVAVERIRDELFKTLAVDNAIHHLKAMDDAGLLDQLFPEITRMKGMEQNDYHHLDVWGHSTLTLELFEQEPVPGSLEGYLPEIEDYLTYESVKGRMRISLLKLAILLHDVGKPATRTMDADGRIRFFDHNLQGVEIMNDIGKRLKLATRETESLKAIMKNHMYPLGLSVFLQRQRSVKSKTRAIRRFIHRTGGECLAILLLSFADLSATQGPSRQADDLKRLAALIGEIADMYFQKALATMPRLIKGDELMKEFDLPASPVVGKLLKKVRKAQMDGAVKTRDDAIKMVRDILSTD